jgi:hypothetical protein
MSRILILLVIVAVLAGCTTVEGSILRGSGSPVSRSFDLDDFSQIETNSAARVEVTRGDTFSVVVDVNENLVDQLDVGVTGDTLHIRLKPGSYSNFVLRAKVTMPKLTGLEMDGASHLTAELAGEDLDVNLNGASTAEVSGTAGRVTIDVNGAARALLGDLQAVDVDVTANGGSRAEINAAGAVTGEANGGALVEVSGSPVSVNIETDGGARVVTK